jgi:hypothetical protein
VCIGVHAPTRVLRDGRYIIGTPNMGPEILRYGATALAFSEPRTNEYKISRYFCTCVTDVTVKVNNPFITNNNWRLHKNPVSKLFTIAYS